MVNRNFHVHDKSTFKTLSDSHHSLYSVLVEVVSESLTYLELNSHSVLPETGLLTSTRRIIVHVRVRHMQTCPNDTS